MKGDVELDNTPKLCCVCACIHQCSEQSLCLTWGLHCTAVGVRSHISTSCPPLQHLSSGLCSWGVLLAGSSASGPSCTLFKWDKKGQLNYSSLFLTLQGFLKMYPFTFFILEDSKHVFPVCRGLDLLSQFPCWWAHLFLFETQAAGYIFYLFHQLCKPHFRKMSCGAGAGWGVNVMNFLLSCSGKHSGLFHLHGSRRVWTATWVLLSLHYSPS